MLENDEFQWIRFLVMIFFLRISQSLSQVANEYKRLLGDFLAIAQRLINARRPSSEANLKLS